MTPDFRTNIQNRHIETEREEDILTHSTALSLDGEKVFLTVEYKIFKGYKKNKDGTFLMKTEFGKPDTKIPDYNTFSIDKVFANNFFGIEELEGTVPDLDTEQKVRQYFNL